MIKIKVFNIHYIRIQDKVQEWLDDPAMINIQIINTIQSQYDSTITITIFYQI